MTDDKELLIEKHFSNQLSEDENLQFETYYASDPEFKREVDFQNSLKIALFQQQDVSFKNRLHQMEQEYKIASTRRYLLLSICTLIVLITILAIFIFPTDKNKKLFEAYFEPQRNLMMPITRGAGSIAAMWVHYENEDYKNALTGLENAFTLSKDSTYLLYIGNAQLATNQVDFSIETLQLASKRQDENASRAEWYLALAYLKNGEKSKTISLLEHIIQNNGIFKDQAFDLLSKLK